MKKANEPERLLIHVDQALAKFNKKILDEIFNEVENMKIRFTEIGVPFDQVNFIKTVKNGCTWIENELYNTLVENNYRGLSEKVIEDLVEREQFKRFVTPIEPLISKISDLLKKIGLTADQVPFNEKDDPIVTNELEQIITEKSKRYAIGKLEIEIYHTMKEFAAISNKLETLLCRYKFPLMITLYTNLESQVPFAETIHSFYPFFVANYDSLETNGCAILEINPDFLRISVELRKRMLSLRR